MTEGIRGILFDWGGTCSLHSVADFFCREVSRSFGLPLKKAEEAYEFNNKKYILGKISGKEFFRRFSKELGIESSGLLGIFLESGKANPEMIEIVRKAGKKYKTGLVSDNYRELADAIESRHKGLFDTLVFSNRVGAKKPHKEIFLIALKELELKPGECIFIDDKEKNVEAARELGMKGILFEGAAKLKKNLANIGVRL